MLNSINDMMNLSAQGIVNPEKTVYIKLEMFGSSVYYTRSEVDDKFIAKAEIYSNYYTKKDTDAKFIPMTSEEHVLYGTDDAGVQTLLTYDVNNTPSTIVKRDSHGSVVTSDPVNKQDAIPLGYGDNRYVKATNVAKIVHGTDGNGSEVNIPYSNDAIVGTVAMRGYDGTLLVGDAVSEQDATNRRTVERMITSSMLSAMRYVGSVPTYDDLPTNAMNGDVYNVLDTGRNYVWDQKNGHWDDFGPNTDFSKFALKSDLPVIERWW